jgi:hypothetical protein
VVSLLFMAIGPVGYAKFLAPFALLILGISAWIFFRTVKLSPLAAALGGIAVMLTSAFFAGACWSVASLEIAIGFDFLALALIVANHDETPWRIRWTRLALAGLCIGVNVMEAADVGALCSIFVAIFVIFKTFTDGDGTVVRKVVRSATHVAVVAAFAGFIAFQVVLSLVGTSIQGIAGTAQNAETKAAQWDWATQWSLPKMETLGIFVPGLFGYRQDTPQDMLPALQDGYRGGVYWGGMGRSPEIDRFFDSGAPGAPPGGMMRFGYGGYYCGILVALVAFWTVAQSFRRQNSPFSETQKKFIWFWGVVLAVSLPLAWGRFAPFSGTSDGFLFYALLYKLPHFSDIRNPAKFFIFSVWALAVLFAYGIHALNRRYLEIDAAKPVPGKPAIKKWTAFDRNWTIASAGVFGASVLGWLAFSGEKPNFILYLQKVGFPDEETAARIGSVSSNQIAAFSLGQIEWFLVLFGIALVLLTLILTGYFSGPRARFGAMLLGAFLVFDLGRANLPFIIHWNYIQKYEVGSLNPVVEILRDQPYEHRVAVLPFEPQQQLRGYDNLFGGEGLYRIEWAQHHFPYYNIQSLDIIQRPRMPEDLKAYAEALSPRGTLETVPLIARHWELTDTRYLLGAAGYLDVLNQQLDPLLHRFRIARRFDVEIRPGVTHPTQLEDLTVNTNDDGDLALFDFTGALPRAKLYANWQVNTNDQANLKTLADLNFDPAKTVLISTPQKDLPAFATNENSGTVEFKSYSPKQIVFAADATAPSVLLLNDKYDPNWHVTVDGRPAELLRCNFLMRGVQVPPGAHTVEFDFSFPNKPLFVTLAAMVIGVGMVAFLFWTTKRGAAANR